MSKKMWLLLASVGVVAFIGGYGATAKAWHANWYGYFFHTYDTGGLEVLPPWGGPTGTPYGSCQGDGWALPGWVDTPGEFINFTICKLYGNTQSRRGGAFIISTMIGQNNSSPTSAQINEFAARVWYASSRGWINFYAVNGCILPNTYYQDAGSGDVAKYSLCGAGVGNGINFYNGSTWYVIKRFCANPVGTMAPLADDINFNMAGSSSVTDTTVIPGQQVTFSHTLTNNGPTATNPYAIGWNTETGPSASGPWSYGGVSGSDGPFGGVYGIGVGSQNVTVPGNAAPNSQICYRLYWSPDTHAGGQQWSTPACATVQYNFTLIPNVTPAITSVGGPVTGNYAEPGDSITFTYSVNNTGTTISQAATCTYRQSNYVGFSTAAAATAYTPAGPPAANCAPSRTFPVGNTTPIATEVIPSAVANTSYCRSLVVSPATFGGPASQPTQACVHVARKPYTRIYGGDIMVGGGPAPASSPATCSSFPNAAIISWNRRGAGGSYGGAGTQFAAYAMNRIFDVATSLNSGGAPTPAGLSFANTTKVVANGNFGGMWANATCMTDYYARRPTTPPSPPTGSGAVTAMTSGIYGASGNVQFYGGGVISPGERIAVYIDGNVHVNTNITYAEPWTVDTMPSFQLIVRGDMFIDLAVARLDGLYVAQPRADGTGGIIYTCASTIPALNTVPALAGTLVSTCGNKLTVNGSFVGRQLRLMRTPGTLRNSSTGEASTSGNIAETFNYNPSLWMAQPDNVTGGAKYDAINSLPPVL